MLLFTNCAGECEICYSFYIGGGCIAGHGDDHFNEITTKDIIKLFSSSSTSSHRRWLLARTFPKILKNIKPPKNIWKTTSLFYGENEKTKTRLNVNNMGVWTLEKKGNLT